MPIKRITIQDIAAACGLSRNTVSKVFNGRGSVPEATKKLVLMKAQELGYYQLPDLAVPAPDVSSRNIALLAQPKLLSHSFGSFFLTSFTDQISRAGYTLKIYEISPEEVVSRQLPPHLDLEETAGILGIELFDKGYLDMICSLRKPTVFVDGHAYAKRMMMNCDFISMENTASEAAIVTRMLDAGAKHIGFVGDIDHCNSFYERWIGYFIALDAKGLSIDRSACILDKDSDSYGDPDWLLEKLSAMPVIPDGFACANDYLAVHLMAALKRKGLSIPADVMVAGFDGSMEAALSDPSLTTARIPSAEIGRLAASLLFERIQYPDFPYRWTIVKTNVIFGGSTR